MLIKAYLFRNLSISKLLIFLFFILVFPFGSFAQDIQDIIVDEQKKLR